jgi:curved DNA-binding protein CbpA
MEASPTYYQILGVDETASPEEIRAAFRRASNLAHPDKGGAPGHFRFLVLIRDTLLDSTRRRDYDRSLRGQKIGDDHSRPPHSSGALVVPAVVGLPIDTAEPLLAPLMDLVFVQFVPVEVDRNDVRVGRVTATSPSPGSPITSGALLLVLVAIPRRTASEAVEGIVRSAYGDWNKKQEEWQRRRQKEAGRRQKEAERSAIERRRTQRAHEDRVRARIRLAQWGKIVGNYAYSSAHEEILWSYLTSARPKCVSCGQPNLFSDLKLKKHNIDPTPERLKDDGRYIWADVYHCPRCMGVTIVRRWQGDRSRLLQTDRPRSSQISKRLDGWASDLSKKWATASDGDGVSVELCKELDCLRSAAKWYRFLFEIEPGRTVRVLLNKMPETPPS